MKKTVAEIVNEHHEALLNKELANHELIDVDFSKITQKLDDAIEVAYDFLRSELTKEEFTQLNENYNLLYILN